LEITHPFLSVEEEMKMKAARIALSLVIALVIAGTALADGKGKDKPKADGKGPAKKAQAAFPMLEGLKLTDGQKAKVEALRKEIDTKRAEIQKKMGSILTAEQKKARQDAEKAAKTAGKKGKEFHDAVEAAVKLTDDQKAKMAAAKKEMDGLQKQIRDKIDGILTPEQKEQLKKAHAAKKGDGKKCDKAAKPAK
jgi:Spy/CpxP family protein refolding chaperone